MSVIFELIFHLSYLATKQIEEQKENDEISRLALNANHHRSTMKIMMMNLIVAIDESSVSLRRGHVGREREEIDAWFLRLQRRVTKRKSKEMGVHRCRHVGKSSMRCSPLIAQVKTLEREIDTSNERYAFALAKRLFTFRQVFSSSFCWLNKRRRKVSLDLPITHSGEGRNGDCLFSPTIECNNQNV